MVFHKFSLTDAVTKAIEQKLLAAGYQVEVQDGPWEKTEDGKYALKKDRLPQDKVVLVISPRIGGFVADTVVSDYQPTIWIVATLLGKDRSEIYRGFHSTGWKSKISSERWKYSPPKTTFPNFDALMAKPEQAAIALNESAQLISESVAEDLRRR